MKIHTYWVRGSGEFPYDMLRYDQCWPADSASATRMGRDYDGSLPSWRSIQITGIQPPTAARWASFCWACAATNIWE